MSTRPLQHDTTMSLDAAQSVSSHVRTSAERERSQFLAESRDAARKLQRVGELQEPASAPLPVPTIAPMNLYVGTSGYAYKEWKGRFYPEGLPAKQMLHYYSQHFRSVEINNTFHRMPKPSVLEGWAAEVPAEFKFVLKAPQRITHIQQLRNAGDSMSYLLNVAAVLEDRLGPLLFQLPPYLKKDTARLAEFLGLLPPACRASFEFRHPTWFDDEVFEQLRQHQAALCLAQAENDLQIPFVATADWGYARLRRLDYSDAELMDWREKILQQNWRDAFVFFKHEDEAKGPQYATRFLELTPEPGVIAGSAAVSRYP
jgi:uncharacterized protein YecE (DUF72 family)